MRYAKKYEGLIDLHSHILPGIDDGASDWEEAREMLRMAYGQGIRCIVATPHFSQKQSSERLGSLYEKLQQEAFGISQSFTVKLGQEILYFEELPDYLERKKVFTLAGSRYVLIEFGPGVSYLRLSRAVRCLLQASYFPVIAHVERYKCLKNKENMENLIKSGAYLQMNIQSLKGNIFDREAAWCRKELFEGNIHFLATDMHNRYKRAPDIEKAVSWIDRHCGPETVERLFKWNQSYILENRIL